MFQFQYCPNCKSANIEFPDHRRFECRDCGMIFFQNIATDVGIIIEKDSKILFTIRNRAPGKGQLDLPGGFTDPEETAEETCARELEEELGIKIAPGAFHYFTSAPNTYKYKDFPYRTEDLIFTAKLPESVTIRLEEDEIQAVKWISFSAIEPEKIAFPSLRKAVIAYIKCHR